MDPITVNYAFGGKISEKDLVGLLARTEKLYFNGEQFSCKFTFYNHSIMVPEVQKSKTEYRIKKDV